MLHNRILWFGIISVILNVIGYIPYIRGILDSKVKPQRITWGIWSILTTIAFINQVRNGGGYSTYFFASTCVLVITVFTLSIPKGTGGSSKFDRSILTAAFILLLIWAITRNTTTTTLIAVAIDAVGALPTLYKAFKNPETEAYLQWILAAFSGGFSLLAVDQAHYILFVYPAYIIVMNGFIVLAKYLGTNKSSSLANS